MRQEGATDTKSVHFLIFVASRYGKSFLFLIPCACYTQTILFYIYLSTLFYIFKLLFLRSSTVHCSVIFYTFIYISTLFYIFKSLFLRSSTLFCHFFLHLFTYIVLHFSFVLFTFIYIVLQCSITLSLIHVRLMPHVYNL